MSARRRHRGTIQVAPDNSRPLCSCDGSGFLEVARYSRQVRPGRCGANTAGSADYPRGARLEQVAPLLGQGGAGDCCDLGSTAV